LRIADCELKKRHVKQRSAKKLACLLLIEVLTEVETSSSFKKQEYINNEIH